MRHKKKFNHLGRKRGHRKAMLSNMASSLLVHKRITTTTAKAKALKVFVEPLITKAKEDTTHSRRHVFSLLQDKEATNELFREIAVKVGERPGGYTRIIKLGKRLGDNADMCIIELVDFNENMLADKAAASKASRRRRGGKKKSDSATATTDKSVEAVSDAIEVKTGEEAASEKIDVNEEAEEVDAEVQAVEEVADEKTAVEETIAEEVDEEKPAVEEPAAEVTAPEISDNQVQVTEEQKAEEKEDVEDTKKAEKENNTEKPEAKLDESSQETSATDDNTSSEDGESEEDKKEE